MYVDLATSTQGTTPSAIGAMACLQPGPVARRPRRSTPIYIQHKPKVPPMTLELLIDGLNPLAKRALDRLPRQNQVPILRAIGKADALGFSFIFKVDPAELTQAHLPALLERWDEKYEVAKARAGLTPKPPAPPMELSPRIPGNSNRSDGVLQGLGGDLMQEQCGHESGTRGAAELARQVTGRAIRLFDAANMASHLAAGNDESSDPLAGAGADDSSAAATVQAEAESLPVSEGTREFFTQDMAPLPEPVSGIAAAPVESADRAPRAKRPGRRTGKAQSSTTDAVPVAQITDLPPWAVHWPGAPLPASAGWKDQGGRTWHALSRLDLVILPKGQTGVSITAVAPDQLPAECSETALQLLDEAQRLRLRAQDWLVQLLEPLLGPHPPAQRQKLLPQACADIDAGLQLLEDILLDMQLAGGFAQRVERHGLGLPDWALDLARALRSQQQIHEQFCMATPPSQALVLLKRWCEPLIPLRRTGQLGLFADPQAARLHQQLGALVHRACRWSGIDPDAAEPRGRRGPAGADTSTRTRLARVLAVWADSVRRGRPDVKKIPKSTAKAQLISDRRGADFCEVKEK